MFEKSIAIAIALHRVLFSRDQRRAEFLSQSRRLQSSKEFEWRRRHVVGTTKKNRGGNQRLKCDQGLLLLFAPAVQGAS